MYTFWSFHVHTQHSLLDGIPSSKELVNRAKELNQPAIGITDHGTISGWMHHFDACKEAGIVPLLGVEFYMAQDMEDKRPSSFKKNEMILNRKHLIAFAKNQAGVDNIKYLVSIPSHNQITSSN